MPDSQYMTFLTATLSHPMLGATKELFPHRTYFDPASGERQREEDHL